MIAVSVLAGLLIQYSPISPMKALFWSAVINGVVAVPLMVVILLLVAKKSVMGAFTANRWIIILGWAAALVMGAGTQAYVNYRSDRAPAGGAVDGLHRFLGFMGIDRRGALASGSCRGCPALCQLRRGQGWQGLAQVAAAQTAAGVWCHAPRRAADY